MKKYISYLRVSTDRQGRSGLGLDAQRDAIATFIKGERLLHEYVEIESGRISDRPKLNQALEHCRDTGATLVIARIDRLARNVFFISKLMESDVDFEAADFPAANKLTIHLLAAVAEHEREMISKRTKEALAAAKAKGVILGKNNLTPESIEIGWQRSVNARKKQADSFALKRYKTIEKYLKNGMSLNAIATLMNDDELLTARGGRWTATTVRNIIKRAGEMSR